MAQSLLIRALLVCASLLPHATAAPTVVDGNVSYVGTLSGGVESFLGIRYGQDTGGRNRFTLPKPYNYPPGTVVNATTPGAACPQQTGNPTPSLIGLFSNVTNISEDCLTVRIERPLNISPLKKLPVVVFLYGGGYAIGQTYDGAYYPSGFVRETARKDLPTIYVAINYRVGIFGFADSSALRHEGNLNLGLEDQFLGLQWVQDHISAFGGDRDDVTLFGEDVGAASAVFQLTAFGGNAKRTFKRVILGSGPTPAGDQITRGLTLNHTAEVTKRLDCASPDGDSAAELNCLRGLSLTTLVDAAVKFSFEYEAIAGLGTFRPTAPSTFIPDVPSKLLREGCFLKNIDVLIGWTEDDGTQFVTPEISSDTLFNSWAAEQWPSLTEANLNKLISLYPSSEFSDLTAEGIEKNYFRAARVSRDAHFACPSLLILEAFQVLSPGSIVYAYVLNQTVFRVGHAAANRSFVGNDHFSDISYVFDYVDQPPYSSIADQSDYDLASLMSGSWASFAHFSRPIIPGVTLEDSIARNLTVAPWDAVHSHGIGDVVVRVIGGPGDELAVIPKSGHGPAGGLPPYDEDLATRCAFWNSRDVLEQTFN